jgi:hypothetical protein
MARRAAAPIRRVSTAAMRKEHNPITAFGELQLMVVFTDDSVQVASDR